MARKIFILTISVLISSLSYLSFAGSNDAQNIILFEHEDELQFDEFVQWLRSVKNIKDVNAVREELTSGLTFVGENMTKEMNIIFMKEIKGRFEIHTICSYGNLSIDVDKTLSLISDLKQCSYSTCSDKGVMDKLSELTLYSRVLEDFISQCKTHMNDIHEIQKVKLD